ncbi:MAG: ABC transporter permease [Acutalibacteraceae bacterium]
MRDFKLILKKEMLDIFRDKRSFVMLFVPVLIFPLMYMLMGTQLDKEELKKNIPCIVDYVPGSIDEELYKTLFESTELVRRTPIEKTATEDLKNGSVYAVIRLNDGQITITYNDASTKSATAGQTLITAVETARQLSLYETIQTKYHVDMASVQPFQLTAVKLSDETGEANNSIMASIAPMMLVMMIMSGGVSMAVDLFTGEKERGTFESLMTTQASRMSILMAKFTATLFISLLGMLLSILAYVISFLCSDSAWTMLSGGAETDGAKVALSFAQIVNLVAVCLVLSVFAVSLMTMIGLHAKTVKEAQSQMSLITIFPTLLSGLTMFMESANIHVAAMWIPVFNVIVSIKMIFLGTAEPIHILFTVLSSLLYSALMWMVSVRMLHSEKLLQG